MKVHLTFDYELFFGTEPGSVQKCMIEPCKQLINTGKTYGAKFVFFVDAGHLFYLEQLKDTYPTLKRDYNAITAQLKEFEEEGHQIQLHIHPHWEKSSFDGEKWTFLTDGYYKLSDFPKEEAYEIFIKYKNCLDRHINQASFAFRAGGWCIQPFEHFLPAFEDCGLKIDSSVFPGGYYDRGNYYYDFRNAPKKSYYRFSTDVVKEDNHGAFLEYPIASKNYSPLFYWRLYLLGRLLPHRHKMVGDGLSMSQPGRKWQYLTSFNQNYLSTDGYYISALERETKTQLKRGTEHLTIIGHPKCFTLFSYERLERYLKKMDSSVSFTTFEL